MSTTYDERDDISRPRNVLSLTEEQRAKLAEDVAKYKSKSKERNISGQSQHANRSHHA